MATVTTLTKTRQNKMPYIANEGKISLSFVCDTVLDRGALVKLLSTGKIAPIAAAADVVIGVVTAPTLDVTQPVTIQCVGSAAIKALTGGTVAIGGVVDATGFNTTEKLSIVTATASGNAIGIALTGGTVGTEIMVLLTKI